ncbi:Golgi transport complex subunit 6 [Savitreella phatthalungensis]
MAQWSSAIPLPATLSATSSNAVSTKIQAVMATSGLDGDLAKALQILDIEAGEIINVGQASATSVRRCVRRRAVLHAASALAEYEPLISELRAIRFEIDGMKTACGRMMTQAMGVQKASGHLLEQVDTLQNTRRKITVRRMVHDAFLRRFMLSEEHTLALLNLEPADNNFFDALSQTEAVHGRCQSLLSLEDNGLGLELLKQLSQLQDSAYAKLYRWSTYQLKQAQLINLHSETQLVKAIGALKARPTLFDQCLEHIAYARKRQAAESLVQALVRGKNGARPIELAAHDSLRFVGDLLAWLHESVATEYEGLEFLVSSRQSGAAGSGGPRSVDRKKLTHLIDDVLSEVMPTLQRRVDQVFAHSDVSREVSLQISTLVHFYATLLSKMLLEESAVLRSLDSIEASAQRRFSQHTQALLTAVRSAPPVIGPSLATPDFITDLTADLHVACRILHDSFLAFDDRSRQLNEMFEVQIRSAVDLCAKASSEIEQPASSIYLLNIARLIERTLEGFNFANNAADIVSSIIARCEQLLIVDQSEHLMRESGVSSLQEMLDNGQRPDEHAHQIVRERLMTYLPHAADDLDRRIELVDERRRINNINKAAALKFLASLEQPGILGDLKYPSDQARLLLGL